MQKLLTVGIPNYNGGENLKRAILSCKKLGLKEDEYEILVVDNCSTDNSVELVEKLQKKIPNIRLVVNDKNIGRIGNWNKIIELSKGKYLLFLMVNDYYEKINLKEILLNMDNKTHYIFSFFSKLNGEKKKNIVYCNDTNPKRILEKMIKTLFGRCDIGPLQVNLFNTNILKEKKIFINSKYEYLGDILFISEYILNFEKIKFLEEELFVFNLDSLGRFAFNKKIISFYDTLNIFLYLSGKIGININFIKLHSYMIIFSFLQLFKFKNLKINIKYVKEIILFSKFRKCNIFKYYFLLFYNIFMGVFFIIYRKLVGKNRVYFSL